MKYTARESVFSQSLRSHGCSVPTIHHFVTQTMCIHTYTEHHFSFFHPKLYEWFCIKFSNYFIHCFASHPSFLLF